MASINKVILLGRLGKDPEAKTTREGKEYSAFSIATSKRIREEERTQWHNVTVWNEHTAKYVNDFAIKGTTVYVEGEIEYRTWTKQDGSTGYSTDIIVGQFGGNVQIVSGGRPRDDPGEGEERERKPRPSRQTRKTEPEKKQREDKEWRDELDDEIPF